MGYEDKDYIDGSAPDGFDVEQDPCFKRWLQKQHTETLLRQVEENDKEDRKAAKAVNL